LAAVKRRSASLAVMLPLSDEPWYPIAPAKRPRESPIDTRLDVMGQEKCESAGTAIDITGGPTDIGRSLTKAKRTLVVEGGERLFPPKLLKKI
jgi:hypothetical protein